MRDGAGAGAGQGRGRCYLCDESSSCVALSLSLSPDFRLPSLPAPQLSSVRCSPAASPDAAEVISVLTVLTVETPRHSPLLCGHQLTSVMKNEPRQSDAAFMRCTVYNNIYTLSSGHVSSEVRWWLWLGCQVLRTPGSRSYLAGHRQLTERSPWHRRN